MDGGHSQYRRYCMYFPSNSFPPKFPQLSATSRSERCLDIGWPLSSHLFSLLCKPLRLQTLIGSRYLKYYWLFGFLSSFGNMVDVELPAIFWKKKKEKKIKAKWIHLRNRASASSERDFLIAGVWNDFTRLFPGQLYSIFEIHDSLSPSVSLSFSRCFKQNIE